MASNQTTGGASGGAKSRESVKETVISVIIAFALAFVFRAFVAEAYVIPTGSMAPTLNGQHMRFVSPQTGLDWAVNPWGYPPGDFQNPYGNQGEWAIKSIQPKVPGVPIPGITVHDPVTGGEINDATVRTRAGDRIFVHKYLYALAEPQAWDVVVFKNPTNPDENFIKRLIALPNEEVALADGDVFVRKLPRQADTRALWSQGGWQVRRKPAAVQRAVWQQVFDSSLLPVGFAGVQPWRARASGGASSGGGALATRNSGREFRFDGGGAAELAWDAGATFIKHATYSRSDDHPSDKLRQINDRYWYNETPIVGALRYPVADVRLRMGLALDSGTDASKLELTATVLARGHEFRALMVGGKVTLGMRAAQVGPSAGGSAGATEPAWRELLDRAVPLPPVVGGTTADIEFWHVDQTLQLWVDHQLVAYAGYDWSPAERLVNATEPEIFSKIEAGGMVSGNVLSNPLIYKPVGVRWTIAGPAATLRRVGLDRDLYYTPAAYTSGPMARTPAAATSPLAPLALGPDQFFCCGDNSPASSDGRLWPSVSPWVAAELDPTLSVVPRELMLGKAFFVYWPSHGGKAFPVPDFGRMRFIY